MAAEAASCSPRLLCAVLNSTPPCREEVCGRWAAALTIHVQGRHSLPTHRVALAGTSRVSQLLVRVRKGRVAMGSPSPLLAKCKDIFPVWVFVGVDLGLQQGQCEPSCCAWSPAAWPVLTAPHICPWVSGARRPLAPVWLTPSTALSGRDKGKSTHGRVPQYSVAWVQPSA